MNEKSVKKKLSFSGIGIIKIWCFLAMINLAFSFDMLIVQNDKEKNNQIWIGEIKKQFESVIEFHQANYSEISELLNLNPEILIILDLSNDFKTQLGLSQICKINRKIHLVVQKNYESNYYDEWTYSIVPSNSVQMEAYFAVLNHFNWTKGLVITDEDNIYAKQQFLDYSENFEYFTIESSVNIDMFVSQIIKPLGTTLYYIFTNSVLSLEMQEALKNKKLLLNGDGIVLNQNSGYASAIDGAIIINLSGQEYALSQEDFLLNMTQNFLQYLINSIADSVTDLKYLLKKYSEKNQFSIVNIRDSRREIVGSISNGIVSIFKKISFPGNSSEIPKADKKILHVTASSGSYNPGTPPVASVPMIFYGAYTAWSLINDGAFGILKNFQIKHFDFNCSASNFDEKYARACFTKDIDKFGLMHISGLPTLVTIGELKLFKTLNLTIPAVGTLARDDSLNSTAAYPLFARLYVSNRYVLTLSSLLFKALGWKKLCVIYMNDTTGRSQYLSLINSIEQYGLEILNPESSRVLNEVSNRTSIKKYTNQLKSIIDTQARLLVLLVQYPAIYYILEELYDIGLRKGDLVTYTISSAYLTMIQYDFMYTYKIKETGVPMFAIDTKLSRKIWQKRLLTDSIFI